MTAKELRPPALVTRDGLGMCSATTLCGPEVSAATLPAQRRATKKSFSSHDIGRLSSVLEQPCTERRITALLTAHPDLSPGGFWVSPRVDASTARHQFILDRASASVQPVHVQAFEWTRTFLALACRRLTTIRSRKAIESNRLARIAEEAAEVVLGQRVHVANGIPVLAALSLDLQVERDGVGPNALLAVRVMWGDGR